MRAAWLTSLLIVLLMGALAIESPRAEESRPVQSLLLRAVITTCKLDESVAFYQDILGQRVIQERDFTAEVAAPYVAVSDTGTVRLVVMEGRGEYPGGPILGGRIAFMGVLDDPDSPACRDLEKKVNRSGHHGDPILPFRVANIDEIMRRAKAAGYEIGFEPRRSPVGLSRNMVMYDPNGTLLELFDPESNREFSSHFAIDERNEYEYAWELALSRAMRHGDSIDSVLVSLEQSITVIAQKEVV